MATTRALESNEIRAVFENIDGIHAKRNRCIFVCGISMAMRATELVSLTVGDFLNGDGSIKTYITVRGETAKFGKERTIRIGEKVKSEIATFIDHKRSIGELLESTAPLFRSQKGGHLTRTALLLMVKKIFAKIGIDQSPHSLRKTGATIYYIESECDLIATQAFLGHANPSTTRRYIGLTSEQIVKYSEKASGHLFQLISKDQGVSEVASEKPISRDKMISFVENIETDTLIAELVKRGININITSDRVSDQRPTAVRQTQSLQSLAQIVEIPITQQSNKQSTMKRHRNAVRRSKAVGEW